MKREKTHQSKKQIKQQEVKDIGSRRGHWGPKSESRVLVEKINLQMILTEPNQRAPKEGNMNSGKSYFDWKKRIIRHK